MFIFRLIRSRMFTAITAYFLLLTPIAMVTQNLDANSSADSAVDGFKRLVIDPWTEGLVCQIMAPLEKAFWIGSSIVTLLLGLGMVIALSRLQVSPLLKA